MDTPLEINKHGLSFLVLPFIIIFLLQHTSELVLENIILEDTESKVYFGCMLIFSHAASLKGDFVLICLPKEIFLSSLSTNCAAILFHIFSMLVILGFSFISGLSVFGIIVFHLT